MKNLLLIILCFFACFYASGQATPFPGTQYIGSRQLRTFIYGGVETGKGFINKVYADTTDANEDTNHISRYPGAQIVTLDDNSWIRSIDTSRWLAFGSGGASAIIPGGPITTIPVVGTNPGTNMSSVDWVIATFYGNQPPLATLTGGQILEYTSASTQAATLDWTASRQLNTTPLVTITVADIDQGFAQPSAPGTVSGDQDVVFTTNTTTVYSNVVTATDAKTATATTTFRYMQKYYIGYIPDNTPTDAEIIAATGGTVGGTFASTLVAAGTLPDPASQSYIVFAYPATFGPAVIKINGLTVGYTLTTRAFVNASGYTSSYNIYVSPFATNGGIEYQVLP